jgi:hypothetical protein
MKTRIEVHDSGDNVFADLGLPNAEAHFLKAQVVAELYRLVKERCLPPAILKLGFPPTFMGCPDVLSIRVGS